MKKAFKVENLDCANCGAKIEDAVKNLDGVNKANLSFMTQRLVLDADESRFDAIVEEVKAICDRIEPGCTIS